MNNKLFRILADNGTNTKECYKALVAEYPSLEDKPEELKPVEKKTVKKKTVKK